MTSSERHTRARRIGTRAAIGTVLAALVGVLMARTRRNPFYDGSKKHHTRTGFRNNYRDVGPRGFWKWQWQRLNKHLPEVTRPGWRCPSVQPDLEFLHSNRHHATVTWIGHATVLLQLGGLNILIDPHFSERASPLAFWGPKRRTPPSLQIEQLPHIDVVLISHNHYDHLDTASVRALAAQGGGAPRFYVPLGLGRWLQDRGIAVTGELDWWQTRGDDRLTIHLVPAQHWSARGWLDRNRTLWAGFVVESNDLRILYAGDTGYSPDYLDIAQWFDGFDLVILPIGAYEPRWFMAPQHIAPAEAVRIHRDLRARHSLAVHWGTFRLSDEPLDEPPRKLRRALAECGMAATEFWIMSQGETRTMTPVASRMGHPVSRARHSSMRAARRTAPGVVSSRLSP